MGLQTYRQKRNFRATPEPRGKVARANKALSFVVQKHAARRLHYDFRLEIGGVLASWAIPKGPSLDPKERRLAVHVEDHPLEYGNFRGTIPKGHYGAGSVEIWDRGTWVPDGNPHTGLRQGKLKFHLNGEKLSGGWNLVRMGRRNAEPSKDNWLLIKERDEAAANNDRSSEYKTKATKKKAVRSGRVENFSSVSTKSAGRGRRRVVRVEPDLAQVEKADLPTFVRPQLATLVDAVPRGKEWLHEIKFDGYRVLCRIENRQATFLTREGNDWTDRFGSLVDAVTALPVHEALFDGEIVALREDGTSDFQLLQNSLRGDRRATIVYFVFDLLYFDGYDLRKTPLLARKEALAKIFKTETAPDQESLVHYSEHWFDGGQLFEEACRRSLEGIISKRSDQPYRSGRSRDWLKVKCLMSQEFVICAYTDPAGSRKGLGALLLAVYDDDGKLHYSGRVGTGFTSQTLKELKARLSKLASTEPALNEPLTGASRKGVHWVKPQLVAEVAFTGWTTDGLLRHPSFQGLREDKPAKQIRRESALPTTKVAYAGTANPAAANSAENNSQPTEVTLSHPDRVLYPEQGITKQELAEYYEKVADWILPHVSGRPLTLLRCPEGHRKQCFYQRHVEKNVPGEIRRLRLRENGSMKQWLVIDSLPGLIALVQMGVLEIHTWGSREGSIERPDRLIFDLDPDPSLPWKTLWDAAVDLRDRLSPLGLGAFVKTTGGKGLHVVVPIEPKQNWNQVKAFAKAFAESAAHDSPDLYVATMSKSRRAGKIFIDYLRNARTATAVCAYSTRARDGAPVSVPIGWDELRVDPRLDHFNVRNVPQRLVRLREDPWSDYKAARRPLTKAMEKQLGR